ncbi:MAG TPA: hypothetical protein VJ770_03350 [Stellaceae bacterium]|nr:hypothetical protein [Stellaceae bacterium]
MAAGLEIALAPERLDEGTPEECACFGLFTIRAGEVELTSGMDFFISAYRPGPLVSGYHAAEWLAWNWWRLRFEPQSSAPEWWRAHKMTAIGEGYVWPNLTIFSDGVRTALLAERSVRPNAKPFRYLGASPCVLPSTQFEAALDAFIPRILGRLRDQGISETNLDCIWRDVLIERADRDLFKRRKLEALSGKDPDEAEPTVLERLVADTALLGEQAVEELAADHARGGSLLTAESLARVAAESGFDASPRDVVAFKPNPELPRAAEVPAWRLGALAARALRDQERLGSKKIDNHTLAKLAGVQARALTGRTIGPQISFALDRGPTEGRVVFRSKWETGRRFELARLLGNRIILPIPGCLHPATRAHTYHQKMQRSFAAELLAPFEAVDEMLAGDYSMEAQQEAAAHFAVSELTIRTLLVNHHKVEREELEGELEPVAA